MLSPMVAAEQTSQENTLHKPWEYYSLHPAGRSWSGPYQSSRLHTSMGITLFVYSGTASPVTTAVATGSQSATSQALLIAPAMIRDEFNAASVSLKHPLVSVTLFGTVLVATNTHTARRSSTPPACTVSAKIRPVLNG